MTLAKDLDNPLLGTSHASLAKNFAVLVEVLRRDAEPKRGRLAAIQEMSAR
ncbi:MAG TPA: hypothetical protein VMU34_26205 [Mycobacterium sp.]|nr:hypothetical protein [Mycobacterium sp.]